ncbi:hypothetical protein ACFZC5_08780 [Nocardia gamkensis]|uniref:hypothetical protein n=1 Tax=Nocardia gamkensis TaxID=352869 RepID=UPI0036E7AB45
MADLDFGMEHTFATDVDFEIEDVTLTEGRGPAVFSEADVTTTELAHADNAIPETFFGFFGSLELETSSRQSSGSRVKPAIRPDPGKWRGDFGRVRSQNSWHLAMP